MADGGRRDGDAVVAAAGGHQRRLGAIARDDSDLVVRAAGLEGAGRLHLLALEAHVGGAAFVRQLTARLEGRVERDPAQPLTSCVDIGEGGHARHARECRTPRALAGTLLPWWA